MKKNFKNICVVFLFGIYLSCSLSFAAITTVDLNNKDAPDTFVKSLKETGFALVNNHGIDLEFIETWKEFFKKPDEFKNKFHHKNHPQTMLGYYPYGIENAEGADHKNQMEYFHYERNFESLPEELKENTQNYMNSMLTLCRRFLSWMDDDTTNNTYTFLKNGQKYSEIMSENPRYTITRILHYPAQAKSGSLETTDEIINVEHTDISLLSLLFATSSGLQVQDLTGQWHDVGGTNDTLVVNAGDMLKWISNDYYQSTLHRVVRKSSDEGERYSFPVFVGVKPELEVKLGVTAGEAFIERISATGIKIDKPDSNSR